VPEILDIVNKILMITLTENEILTSLLLLLLLY